jgi:hypothetical protein
LSNEPHPGPAPTYGSETGGRILAALDRPPLAGFVDCGWRFSREHKIDLVGRERWCERDASKFVAKAADAVGFYMAPPENAIVIGLDEKLSIRASERA